MDLEAEPGFAENEEPVRPGNVQAGGAGRGRQVLYGPAWNPGSFEQSVQHVPVRVEGIQRRMRSRRRALEEAKSLYRGIGDRGGEVTALNESGTLRRDLGDLTGAEAIYREALDLAREIGSSWDEAHALAGLGRCALAAGRTAEAAGSLRQALEIFQQIGAAEAPDLLAELDALFGPSSAQ